MKVLRATGDKISGRGAAIIIAAFFCGDVKFMNYIRPGDSLIVGVPLKFTPATVPRSETRQAIMTSVLRSIMKIINSKFDATTITAQETAMVAFLNLLIDSVTYADFKVAGTLGTDSLITPSYSAELGFNFHCSLAAKGT